MGDQQELAAPPPPPPPSDADMTADQKLFALNALQVVDDWSVHDDGDGRLFYYDRKTDASQWEVPESLASLETEFMMKLMLQNAVARSGVWTAHDAGNGTLYYFNSKRRESVWERPSEWGEAEAKAAAEAREQEAADAAQRDEEEKQKEKAVRKEKRKQKRHKKHLEKRNEQAKQKEKVEEAVVDEKEEEEPLTAEEMKAEGDRKAREQKRIEQFRAMLRDKNIMPFCKWSVALPQIAGDPRFMGVPTMDERRAIFEHFVEHRREDLKAEKKNKLKEAKQIFTQLLREQFQLDSWEPSTTISVFLSTLESRLEPERFKQIQDEAMALLTMSVQEKLYTKAVDEYKSEGLKRDGEQLRLTKFLEEKLAASQDKSAMRWGSDEVQRLIREFYSTADAGAESTALLPEQKQRQVFDELAERMTRGRASPRKSRDPSRRERSHSRRRSPPRERTKSRVSKERDPSPRRESRRSDHGRRSRSRSRSHRRRSRSDSRSRSRGRERGHRSRNSSRRRSPSSSRSRSRSREERSPRSSPKPHDHSVATRRRSRTRWS
jgi:hypothetical protein